MDAGLAAEPAADLGGDHADVALVHPERTGELTVEAVRHLRRCPEREPSVGVDLGRAAVRLHRHHGDALVHVATAHDAIGAGEAVDGRVDVGLGEVRSVVVEDQRRPVGERIFGVDHRRQRLDVGPDHLRRVLALLGRLGQHDRDRFADEAHLAGGERRADEVGVDRARSRGAARRRGSPR